MTMVVGMVISGAAPEVAVDRGKVFGENSQPPSPFLLQGGLRAPGPSHLLVRKMKENEGQLRACTAPRGRA